MKTRLFELTAATALAGSLAASPAFARDEIKIAGSSTVMPYAKFVADGALAEYGLVPLPDAEAKAVRDAVEKLTPMVAKS